MEIKTDKQSYNVWAKNPITHPLASRDKGFDRVDCSTDLSSLEPKDIAKMVMYVNDNATNSFIQQIRRRLSILERPLMTQEAMEKLHLRQLQSEVCSIRINHIKNILQFLRNL